VGCRKGKIKGRVISSVSQVRGVKIKGKDRKKERRSLRDDLKRKSLKEVKSD